jgi:hypothetical protein
VAVGLAAAAASTALFEADLGRSLLLSSTMVAGVPPVLYLLLAFALLRGAPFGRCLGWAVAACGIYAGLGLASGVTLSLTHPMSMEGALRRALWSFAPAPFIHLLAAPLVLLAWRSRVLPVRITLRAASEPTPFVARVPAPPLPAATPDWDSVLQVPSTSQWTSSAGAAMFERPNREREALPDPVAPVEPAPALAPVAAPPPAPVPAPAPAPMVAVVAAPVEVPLPPRPIVMAPPVPPPPPPPPRPMVAAPAPPPPVEESVSGRQEPVVRVPFERVADQLPPDMFTLPPARLGESLHEPHVLLIPRRLVLPQLGEGAVEIPWTLVDGQFPDLAFAMPQNEVRRRFPDWVISLPMDEVVRQVGMDAFRVQSAAADLSDIRDFPAPFNPGLPEPEETPAPEPAAAAESTPRRAPAPPSVPAPIASRPASPPARAVKAEIAVAAPAAAPAATPAEIDASIPDVLFVPMVPQEEPAAPAPVMSSAVSVQSAPTAPPPVPVVPPAPIAPAVAVAPPVPMARPTVETPPPAPTPQPIAVTPPPSTVAQPIAVTASVPPSPPALVAPAAPVAPPVPAAAVGPSRMDEESEALGRALALELAPLGAFDWRARRVGGRSLVCFVPPALAREGIDGLTAGATPLVERLASWGIEQVTIRTTRLVCVLTPLGGRGCLAAAVRRGGPVAMLELISTRAARATGEVASTTKSAAAFPAVATAPTNGGSGHRAVGEAVRALTAFGTIASSVAEAEGAAPSVYVFAGQDQAVLAGAARAVHEALVRGHDHEALGRLESVVLRRGRERTIVRPLRDHTGAPAVLAAAGEVTLPGRAHRAAAQAAALLEAR